MSDDQIRPSAPHPGAPIETGPDPMGQGRGPAAWADRPDHPDFTLEGEPRIQPMSVLAGWEVHPRDPDPRGMPLIDMNGVEAGRIVDIWVDRSEPAIRYLEAELAGGDRILVPIASYRIQRGRVRTKALSAELMAGTPRPAHPDRITLQEEDRVMAYWAGGYMYADPEWGEPWL